MVISKNKDKFLTNIAFCPGCSFRPTHGKIGVLSNLFSVPVLALTGTATRATKSGIIQTPWGSLTQLLLNWTKIGQTYNMPLMFAQIEEMGNLKLELKTKRNQMPLTLVYGNCWMFPLHQYQYGWRSELPFYCPAFGKKQAIQPIPCPVPWAWMKSHCGRIGKGTRTHRVLFVTIAFGLGIDCSNIRHVIHIGVPYTMEDYCQEVGRVGRHPARVDIYYNSYDISKSRENMWNVMRNFAQSKQCKWEMILSYFDHGVPYKPNPAHVCCDFCRRNCICDVCAKAIPGATRSCSPSPSSIRWRNDERYPHQWRS